VTTNRYAVHAAVALAIAGSGFAMSASAQTDGSLAQLPTPPGPGCYHLIAGRPWQRIDCATPEYIKRHVPRPELILGVKENEIRNDNPTPFTEASVEVNFPSQFDGEVDSQFGDETSSIQLNVFFTGNNGDQDAVQFTNQAEPPPPAEFNTTNNVCVWQIDVNTQNYNPTCVVASAPFINKVTGYVYAINDIVVTLAHDGSDYWMAAAQDQYDLEGGTRFNNASGNLLGYGNGSRASFSGSGGIMTTTLDAATCRSEDVLETDAWSSPCTAAKKLDERALAFASGSPGEPGETVESNNLTPVTGNPSTTLPALVFDNPWAVKIAYASTLNGKCPSGKPPLCK
jgi:hypothetical protein